MFKEVLSVAVILFILGKVSSFAWSIGSQALSKNERFQKLLSDGGIEKNESFNKMEHQIVVMQKNIDCLKKSSERTELLAGKMFNTLAEIKQEPSSAKTINSSRRANKVAVGSIETKANINKIDSISENIERFNW